MRGFVLTLTLLAAASTAHAEERDLCAQRPGKATPPCVLDAGRLQLEVGLADAVFQRSGGVHEDIYELGALALRLGLTPRVELEAAWTPRIVDRVRGGPHASGTGDTTLGALAALTDPDGKGLAVSLQGFVTAPTATHHLGAGGWTGGVRLPVAVPLSEAVGFSLTPEVDILRDAAGRGTHAAYVGVGGLSRTAGQTTLGVELWGEVEDEPAGTIRRATADLTAAYVVGKDVQLDAGANFGLNRATPGLELYVGVSRRF